MTIILFLVDTSASMSQRTYLGARPTLLDVSKDAIEKFLKLRQKDPASRGDRYMLLTFEDPPFNVKAGWKEHHNAFMTELKNLTATGMTTLGPSLKHSFDLLNLNRMQTGIDTYGQGRCPFYLEPSVIIVITDGGKLSNNQGIQDTLTLPMHSSVPGSELTKEPFRWDQRMFALVLRLTGTVPSSDHLLSSSLPSCDDSPIDSMCNVTGGRSYSVTSQRSLMNCLDSIVSKIQGGVVINFEKVGSDPLPITPSDESTNSSASSSSDGGSRSDKENNLNPLLHGALMSPSIHEGVLNGFNGAFNGNGNGGGDVTLTDCDKASWTSCRKLIYVQRSAQKGYSVGHWPIPESFWPDMSAPALPARTAHPAVKFTCMDTVPMTIENLPFDKYELEPSALTKVILNRRSPNLAWQCYVTNSHKNSDSVGFPFGYLKASSNMSCVNLFVLPYNYPALLPLLDDLMKNQVAHNMKPSREWKSAFESYLSNLPAYYAAPLKRALQRMGAPASLIPDNMETCLSYQVLNYLKRLKNQAKAEFDKTVSAVGIVKSPIIPEPIRVVNPPKTKKIQDMALLSNSTHSRFAKMRPDLLDFPGFVTRVRDKYSEVRSQSYRNPYDITRHELIDQVYRMRANFMLAPGLIRLQDEDQMHSLPVCQMGNYQEHLKRIPSPLRELESAPTRQHMFGNPFKIDKRGGSQSVNQIPMEDIDLVGQEGNNSGNSGNAIPIRSPKRSYGSSDASNPNRKNRKPGPLPRDFILRPISPPPSPSPSSNDSRLTPPPEFMDTDGPSYPILDQGEDAKIIDLVDDGDDSTIVDIKIFDDELQIIPPSSVTPSDSDPDEGSDYRKGSYSDGIATNNAMEVEVIDKYSLVMREDDEPVEFDPSDAMTGSKNRSNFDYAKVNGTSSSSLASLRASPPILTMNSFSYCVNGTNRRVLLKPEELETKRRLFKLVKKPGKADYQTLLDSINSISDSSFRDYIVAEVKTEAKRFKRKNLIDFLTRKLADANHNTTTTTKSGTNSMNHSAPSNHVGGGGADTRTLTSELGHRRNPLLKDHVE